MSKRRRLEITTFRRRITIVSRDSWEVGPTGRPPGDGEASHPIRVYPAPVEEIDLDQTQITDRDLGQFGVIPGRNANDRKST